MARTTSGIIAVSALAAALMAAATPASAQGLFDALFGRAAPRQAPQALSYAPPSAEPREAAPREGGSVNAGSGRATAFCVRTCDGRHFPMQRHRNATPAQLCSAMCPAAKTMVFSGSAIDHAVGPKGERYASLENAFVYRKQVVPDCTCNGKNAFGLAPVDIADDPTLHPGDIVATKTGLVAYTGSGRKSAEANFTPIQNYPALGNDLRNKLSKLDVAQ
jgi:Protein of unknown function (DUF2865)